MNDYKTSLDKEPSSQQEIYQYFNKKNSHLSLPKSMPLLQLLWIYPTKKGLKQNSIVDFLNNEDENNEKYIQKPIIKYSIYDNNAIDYYSQIRPSIMQLFFDATKLRQDYINTFHSKWTELMKTNVEKCIIFQDKIIMLYSLICIIYLKNIFTI
ncbi:MAG: hypothetical protein ACTHKF_06030 [Candidatus Nitrosocosmicus sp.]